MAQQKFSVAIKSEGYQNLINSTLGDKEIARQFIADISTVVATNPSLQECNPATILSAGLTAQTLKLPLAPTLGYAYVVPYNNKGQFQIGWKGLVQLAQRSGLYSRLGARVVHKGEYIGQDKFGDDEFKFSHECDNNEVVGYYAYFVLTNGFEKSIYWTKDQCERHAKKYSQTYKKGFGKWAEEFDSMALKTVLKQLLSKWGAMSIDLQNAIQKDQSVINSDGSLTYVDNEDDTPKKKTSVDNNIMDETGEVETIDLTQGQEETI